jgi:protein SCO1/2
MALLFSAFPRARLRTLSLTTVMVLVLAGCTLRRSYQVQGRVAGFGDDGRTVIVEHEAVPGLMPAMTMSFTLRDGVLPEGLAVQDAVRFRLVLTRTQSWIDNLEVLPDSAVAAHPAGRPDPAFTEPSPLLSPGDPAPAFTLVNQNGKTITRSDFEGQALLVTFIYTRCPLPDYCPLLSRHFRILQPRLHERFGDRVHLLSISFDPAHDTPDVLRTYARRYTDDTRHWTFATGSPETIARLAEAFGVFYEGDGQTFDHNLATALLSPDGRVYRIWRGNTWRPDAVLEALETLSR